jgi:hypothetical protein
MVVVGSRWEAEGFDMLYIGRRTAGLSGLGPEAAIKYSELS